MAKENEIRSVVVTPKGATLLEKDKKISDLEVGQLGIFDYDSNLSVDKDSIAKSRRIYFILKKENGLKKSMGSYIDLTNLRAYTVRPYTPSVSDVVVFKDFTFKTARDYTIRVEAINEYTKFTMGTNSKFISLIASSEKCNSCKTCDDCEQVNPIPVVKELMRNAKKNEFLSIKAIARQDLTTADHGVKADIAKGKEVTMEDFKALTEFNKGKDKDELVHLDLEFTSHPIQKKVHTGYNYSYYYPRETFIKVHLGESFIGNGEVEYVSKVSIEEGSGYDIREKEYNQYHINSPEYLSKKSQFFGGVEFQLGLCTDVTENYDQIHLTYGQKAQVGTFLNYDHGMETLLAIPTGDKLLGKVLEILDVPAEKAGFDALKDDAEDGFQENKKAKTTKPSKRDKDGLG